MNNNCNSAATDFFCYAMRYDSVCTADYDTAPVIRAKLIPAGVCALVTSASSEYVVLSTTIPHASGS
jgi:hypothetical protein